MRIVQSDSFKRDYKKLPEKVKRQDKKLSKDFVVDVLQAFCKKIEKDKACKLLGISKVQLYKIKKKIPYLS